MAKKTVKVIGIIAKWEGRLKNIYNIYINNAKVRSTRLSHD